MDLWMKVLSAVALGAMFAALLPRAKTMLERSPQAGPGDWRSALLPIAGVVALVAILMALV